MKRSLSVSGWLMYGKNSSATKSKHREGRTYFNILLKVIIVKENYLIFVIDLAVLLEAGLTLLLLRGSVLCHHNVVALFCKGTRFLFYGHKLYHARVRLSFETSFDSKHPKLEPELVSALSETKRLFRFYSFGVSVNPKFTKTNRENFFYGFVKQPENNRNRLSFFIFYLFRGHPSHGTSTFRVQQYWGKNSLNIKYFCKLFLSLTAFLFSTKFNEWNA